MLGRGSAAFCDVFVLDLPADGGWVVGSDLMTSRGSNLQLKQLIALVLWVFAAKIVWDLATGG